MRQIVIVMSAILALALVAGGVKIYAGGGKPIMLALNPQPEPPNKPQKGKQKPQKMKQNIPQK